MSFKIRYTSLIAAFFMFFASVGFAQNGPGGVGNSSSVAGQPVNILWLRADTAVNQTPGGAAATGNTDPVQEWKDISGNGNDFVQTTSGSIPLLSTGSNGINGQPVITFDGIEDKLEDSDGGSNYINGLSGYTIFFITRSNVTSSDRGFFDTEVADNQDDVLGIRYDDEGANSGRDNIIKTGVNTGDQLETSSTINGVPVQSTDPQLIGSSWNTGNPQRFFLNGSEDLNADISDTFNSTLTNAGNVRIGHGVKDDGSSDGWDGDVAEAIIYTSELNAAQLEIVHNYLSARYNITIPNDFYTFDGTFPGDIAGIGNSGGETHTTTASDTLLEVNGATSLDDGDFLMFGHDRGNDNSWTTTEAPNGGTNIQRIAREWRLTETGDVGTISVSVDTTKLPSQPSGLTKYALLVDSDGNFDDGDAKIFGLDRNGGGSPLHSASGVEIADADFVTLAILDPILDFSIASSNGIEDTDSNPRFEVELNYITNSNVTAEFFTTDGSATGVSAFTDVNSDVQDYIKVDSGSPQSITVNAGTDTTSFELPKDGGISIHNDTQIESDEDFTLTLQNASGGNSIGSNSPHTYTINDDDNPRKIFFAEEADTVMESNTSVTVTVEINDADTNPTSADFSVTGGTATGSGTDFTLADGTATVPGDNTSTTTTFSIDISDDSNFEGDETVIVELSNPSNANLGDGSSSQPTTFTLVIEDDEAAPTVEFNPATSNGDESISSVDLTIEQSTTTATDTELFFSIAGTATGGGTDFSANTTSPVIISSGDLLADLNFSITDDGSIEFDETIEVTIDSANNATLGSNTIGTYTINDNDGLGSEGPAGNADGGKLLLWLRADSTVLQSPSGSPADTDGQDVGEWQDLSGNNHNFTQSTAANRPILRTGGNGINNQPTVEFDGTGQFLEDADGDTYINGISGFTVIAVTRSNATATDAGFFDTVNPDGADDNLALRYDDAGAQSNRNDIMKLGISTDGGTANGTIETSETVNGVNVQTVNPQISTFQWASGNNLNFFLNGAEDTNEFIVDGPADGNLVGATTALIGVGPKDALGTTGWNGDVAELIIYNSSINSASRQIIHNYIAHRYNITIPSGKDVFDDTGGTFNNDIAGIGRVDANNFHTDAKGTSRVRIFSPGALDNGDFLLWGHDGAAFTTEETDVPSSIDNRLKRVWRVTETGEVGNVNFSIDLSGFTINDGSDIRLLIDRDGDGTIDFANIPSGDIINEARSSRNNKGKGDGGSKNIIQGTFDGTTWTADNSVDMNDGDMFTVGSTSNENSLPVTLSSFEVAETDDNSNQVLITWRTETEQSNFGFRLEKRFLGLPGEDQPERLTSNDSTWSKVGFVEGQGTKKTPTDYSYVDQNISRAGKYEYRIVQMDFDGNSETFGPVNLTFDVPDKFNLSNNYPNPFNPTTTIPFSVPETGNVTLKVYNVLGREVATLVDEVRQPGTYQVTFDASQLSSGIYIARLTGDGVSMTQKLTLIK